MRILLVGNYLPDAQESMQRFSNMLVEGLTTAGQEVRLLHPTAVLGALEWTPKWLRKWLAYIDKYLLFPRFLRGKAAWADVVHICDHSNSPYLAQVRDRPHLITCHDLLAVRGAFGEETDCPATATGKVLQRWIFKWLKKAQLVVCVSSATQRDLVRLVGGTGKPQSSVVLLSVPEKFQPLPVEETRARLAAVPEIGDLPFLLNVGSSLRRKNREGVLRIFNKLRDRWAGHLIFAGEGLTPDLDNLARKLMVRDRVIEIKRPSDSVLEALYNRAFALLFPTRFEGFGWPIIEAQSCGCPVVASTSTSLPEVAAESALLRPVEDESGFAEDILRLQDAALRESIIQKGFKNVKRFAPGRMVNDYLDIYRTLCRAS